MLEPEFELFFRDVPLIQIRRNHHFQRRHFEISTSDISKTLQLKPKQPRWISGTIGKRKKMWTVPLTAAMMWPTVQVATRQVPVWVGLVHSFIYSFKAGAALWGSALKSCRTSSFVSSVLLLQPARCTIWQRPIINSLLSFYADFSHQPLDSLSHHPAYQEVDLCSQWGEELGFSSPSCL